MSILLVTLTFFLSCFALPISADAANNAELAAQVCNRTADSTFCMNTFNSDPSYQPSATADPVSLAYIVFSKAYLLGNDMKANIMSNITMVGVKRSVNLNGMKNCQGYYTSAVAAVYQVLDNLESETYCFFDTLSATAQSNATACGKGLRGNQMALARDNNNFINLTGICYAVAMLFPYRC